MSINLLILGLATTVSPLFLLSAVIMMSTSQTVRTSWAAAMGWFVSIGSCALFMVLVGGAVDGAEADTRHWWMGALDIVLGVVLLIIAARYWRRSHLEHGRALPKWMERVGSMSVVFAFGLGLFLPPTVLALAAGNEISQQHLSPSREAVAIVLYALVGSMVEILPILWLTVQPSRREHRLRTWNAWLDQHWQEVLAVLFGVISFFLFVKGGIALRSSL